MSSSELPESGRAKARVFTAVIRDGHVLMARHVHDGCDYWTLPGGGVEPGETHFDAARREVLEETGIHAVGLRELFKLGCETCFVGTCAADASAVLGFDPELPAHAQMLCDVAWFSLDEKRDDIQVSRVLDHLQASEFRDASKTCFAVRRIVDGREYELTWTATRSIDPSIAPIRQALTVCIGTGPLVGGAEGSLEPFALVLRKPSGRWFLPGGRLEPGETPEEAARREVAEEATIDVVDSCLIGYQHVRHLSESVEAYYQLRYAARVARVRPALPDPDAGESYERRFVPLKELNSLLGWYRIGDALQAAAEVWWHERVSGLRFRAENG